ncbi:MAG: BTAD domain-containing putative transcriptional regulator [Candidatus Brocadiaceae bacterium]
MFIHKLTPPIFNEVHIRKRLFRVLERRQNRPITWISGPPGSGKTALVVSYIKSRKVPFLWYHVDETDADIEKFFYCLDMAVKKTSPHISKSLPLLTQKCRKDIVKFTLQYFENFYSRLEGRFTIVFDNYHKIAASSKLHEIICKGMLIIPEKISAIFVSRHDTPPVFSKLRANDKIHFLGWNELRLTLEESQKIIRKKQRSMVSRETTSHLHNKTDGWVAGLVLMLEDGKTKIHVDQSKDTFNQSRVFDYFACEVFDDVGKCAQTFLLKTAFLPKMTVPMAERLTGINNAKLLLSHLCKNNYFVYEHFSGETAYQYHPLFRNYLLFRARGAFQPAELAKTKETAARILEESGQFEDAAELFLSTGDWNEAARIILKHAQKLITQGNNKILKNLLAQIPEEIREQSPVLFFWFGACQLSSNPAESQHYFEKAFHLFRKYQNKHGACGAWAYIVHAILCRGEDYTCLDTWIKHLEDTLAQPTITNPQSQGKNILWDAPVFDSHTFSSPLTLARLSSAMFIALVLRNQHHAEFNNWMECASLLSAELSDENLKVLNHIYQTLYQVLTGNLVQADMVLSRLKNISLSRQYLPLEQIMMSVAAALYYWHAALPGDCLTAISVGLKTARDTGIFIWHSILLGCGAAVAITDGNTKKTNEFLCKMSQTIQHGGRLEASFYHYLTAWNALLQRDIPGAIQRQKIALKMAGEGGFLFWEAVNHYGMAQVFYENTEYRKTTGHLKKTYEIGRQIKNPMIEYMCRLADAQFAMKGKCGNHEKQRMLKHLRKAMALGRKHGYVNFFSWRPSVMARLCMEALENGIEVEYVQHLIQRRNLIPETPSLNIENWPWKIKIFTMGYFEVIKDGKIVKCSKKMQKKPFLMLKVLITLGGKDVKEEQISDILWPDADGDAAHSAFKMTLSRLRRLIGYENTILVHEGRITINPQYCWVDVWVFEKVFSQIEECWKVTQTDNDIHQIELLYEKLFKTYRGHFLSGDTEYLWAVSNRERIKSKFLRCIVRLGQYYEQTGKWEKARDYYQKGLDMDDTAEEFYQRLILCQHHMGYWSEAIIVYQRCKKTLLAKLGIEPSPKTKALYQTIVQNKTL